MRFAFTKRRGRDPLQRCKGTQNKPWDLHANSARGNVKQNQKRKKEEKNRKGESEKVKKKKKEKEK